MPGIINKCKELAIEEDDFIPYDGKPEDLLSINCPICGYYNSCLRCNDGICEHCGVDIYRALAGGKK